LPYDHLGRESTILKLRSAAMTGYRDFETDITVQANQKVTVKTALTPASITAEAPEST